MELEPALDIKADDVSIGSQDEIIPRQDVYLNSNQPLQTNVDELFANLQNRVQEDQMTLQMQLNEMQQRFQRQFDEVLSAIREQIIIANNLMPASESSSIRDRRDTSTQTEDFQPNVRPNGKRKIESSQLNARAVESEQRRTYTSSVATRSEVEIKVDGFVDDSNIVDNRYPKLILSRLMPNNVVAVNESSEIHRTDPQELVDEVEQDSTAQPECVNGEIVTNKNSDSDRDGQSNARAHERMSVDETVVVDVAHPLERVPSPEIPTFSDENSTRSGSSVLNRRKVPSNRKRKNLVHSSSSYHGNISTNRKQSKTFPCEVCNRRFNQNGNLIAHLRIHTGEKPYKCRICDASFKQNGNLTTHLRIHTGEKPYKCQICDASFKQNGNLTTHLRIHTGEKPYKCQICDKSFSDNSYLAKHLRIHTGKKPYKCQICDKSFSDKRNSAKHLRIHTGEKPFECDICKKSFREKTTLSLHMNIHSGRKPYECNVCKKKFCHQSSLRFHLKKHV